MKGRILVVGDEAKARSALMELLREEGFEVDTAADGFQALDRLPDFAPDVVLTELKTPGMVPDNTDRRSGGMELLRTVRDQDPEVVVVVTTASAEVETAVEAMRQGAVDYLTKPINMAELTLVLERELERRRLKAQAGLMRARLAQRYRFENLVGNSAPMQQVFKTVAQVASSRASVLITGEPGTGKELIAAAIHEQSPRSDGPFVKLHCAALAETILESELFGHERGSFTGAEARRDGRFYQAGGGTLLLDEIGEVSPAVQVKLLRFLQEHAFERVGGKETLHADVRVIAASNRDLERLVEEGRFREDLYYRLNVINIDIPPLRHRPSDIPLLAMHFLRKYAGENGKPIEVISSDALQQLSAYSWPGNVRELENIIERAVVLCPGPAITTAELSPDVPPILASAGGGEPPEPPIPGSRLEDIERYAILKTLEATGGSTGKSAEILGISVRKIQYKLHEYGSVPRVERPPVAPAGRRDGPS